MFLRVPTDAGGSTRDVLIPSGGVGDFGLTTPGTNIDRTLVLRNSGTGQLFVTSVAFLAGDGSIAPNPPATAIDTNTMMSSDVNPASINRLPSE